MRRTIETGQQPKENIVKKKSRPEIEPDPAFLELAIAIFARHGNKEMLLFINKSLHQLQVERSDFEKLFPGREIGNNPTIMQLSAVLGKVGLTGDLR